MRTTLLSLIASLCCVTLPANGQTAATPNDIAATPTAAASMRQPVRLAGARSKGSAAHERVKRDRRRAASSTRASAGGVIRVAQVAGQSAGPERVASAYPGDGNALHEVIVTAQKYKQRAFDVPISMSVLEGPELRNLGITNIDDLQFYVPGMSVVNTGNYRITTIRGVSNAFGQWALVGTYLDEADVTSEGFFGMNLETYDLSRVEVLKGPQGTLYGEGAVGGAIRYITNAPVLTDLQAGVQATAMFDQYGAPESRIVTMLNAPVVNGVFGLRLAAELDNGGGWADQPAANRDNVNSRNLADARIQGRLKLGEDLTLNAMEVIHRETTGPYNGENQVGIYTQVFGLQTTGEYHDNYNISNLTLNWEPGPITLVNSTTYFTHYAPYSNYGDVVQLAAPPVPPFSFLSNGGYRDESFSNELRVSGNMADRWHWSLGGFYKSLDDGTPSETYYFGAFVPPGFAYSSDVKSRSTSVFGDTNFRVVGDLVLGAGVRYFRDDENSLITGDTERETATFSSVDPRFYARYGVSKDVNIYASAAKGFRSGGFNGFGLPQFQPEEVWTYELGTKMRLLDDRLSMDMAAFLSNYSSYQIVGLEPNVANAAPITHNAGEARMKGIESEVTWAPGGEWQLGVNGNYTSARFVNISVLGSSYQVGDPVDNVPRYQVTAWTQREFSWGDRPGFARIDYTQRAPETYRNRMIGPWYYSTSDYVYLLGFRTGVDLTSTFRLDFFVQNILDDRGYTGPNVVSFDAPRSQPRTFGVDFDVNLE